MKRTPLKRKSGPPRRGRMIPCLTCGEEFYVKPSEVSRKYCSPKCFARVTNKERTCIICDAKYHAPPRQGRPKKTCSVKCRNEAVRRGKLGKKNPTYKEGRRAERWRSALESRCCVCGGSDRLVLHHVVYEQHVRDKGGDCFDPRDALTVCFVCHMAHHHASKRIPFRKLRAANIDYAYEVLGPYAADYIRARYPMADK